MESPQQPTQLHSRKKIKAEITFLRQVNAVFRKNFALQRHQLSTTVCQLLVPVILIAIIGLFQIILDNQVASMEKLQPPATYSSLYISDTGPASLADLNKGIPYFRVTVGDSAEDREAVVSRLGSLTVNGDKSGFLGRIPQKSFLFGTFNFPHFIPEESAAVLNEDITTIYEYWKETLDDKLGFGPKGAFKPNGTLPDPMVATFAAHNEKGQVSLMRKVDYDEIGKQIMQWIADGNYTLLPPYGGVIVNALDWTDGRVPSLDMTLRPGSRYGGWHPDHNYNVSKLSLVYPEVDRRGNMINVMNNAFAKSVFGEDGAPVIYTWYQGLPQKVLSVFDLSGLLGIYLLGFAVSFMLPTFISNLVIDRHEKVLDMMQMSGLKMTVYWLVTVFYNMISYSIVMAALWITAASFKMRVFTQTDPLILIALFFMWGLSMNMMAFFFSTFFRTPRSASIVGYLVVIGGVIISNLLNGTVFLNSLPPLWYFIYPPFAFYRAIFIIEDACIRLQCLSLNNVSDPGNVSYIVDQFGRVALMLVLMTFVFGVIGWLRKRSADSDKSWWQNIKEGYMRIRKLIRGSNTHTSGYSVIGGDEESVLSHRTSLSEQMGLDLVHSEKQRILDGGADLEHQNSLVIKGLNKTFGNGHVAVRDMYLALPKGQCFGLLGANGAGKTTLISCLTGVRTPTRGTALFANGTLDLNDDLSKIQPKLGVCMQFDVFYPKLTVMEHILFYARLKGVHGKQLIDHVDDIIVSVGLDKARNRQASQLSGGMRRRLSLGIAIIGDPDVIILDEPSTGLDPLTRRQVWTVFTDMRKRRVRENHPVTVILTTHGMDEADELCERIGIMTRGRLMCIGSPESLKAQYDVGYQLTMQVSEDLPDSHPAGSGDALPLSQFLKDTLEKSSECSSDDVSLPPLADFTTLNGIRVKFLPDMSVNHIFTFQLLFPQSFSDTKVFSAFLRRLFSCMTAAKVNNILQVQNFADTGVKFTTLKEWGLNQTSLEDVFLKVVKSDKQ